MTNVDPENVQKVNVKLDSSQIEIQISTLSLKMKDLREHEPSKNTNNPLQ